MTDYVEYTIRVDDSGVRSTHDKLVRKAQGASRAKKWSGNAVEAEGDDDGVADLLAYLTLPRKPITGGERAVEPIYSISHTKAWNP